MRERGHIPTIEKAAALAAALLGIPYEHRVLMTAEQVLSLVHMDHDPVPHAHGGPDLHFNLTPLSIMAHRRKTAEIDVPQIAKTRRLRNNQALHEAAMASKRGDYKAAARILATAPKPKHTRKIPSRPFLKVHRPLRSRVFERRAP